MAWWEFNGKKRSLPKNLIYRKGGWLDMRYAVNRTFIADRRWVYRFPIMEIYQPYVEKSLTEGDFMTALLLKDLNKKHEKRKNK